MLSLTEIKGLLLDSPSTRKFKLWSEVFLDLLVIGLFLLVILSWQSIFYSESAGLVCVYTNLDNSELALSDGRYFSSRCLLESPARLSLFFPYFQFLQFLLIMLAQIMWVRIPKIKSKLDLYYDILTKIYEIEPKFEQASINMVPKIIFDQSTQELSNLIHDKLVFLITEKSSIVYFYISKNIINVILLVIFISVDSYWIYTIIIIGVDFSCTLKQQTLLFKDKIFPNISCNVSPFYFFLGYICLFLMILIIIFFLTIYNLTVLRHLKQIQNHVNDLFGSGGDRLCGLPGFLDFSLYITMLNSNVKDGGFHLEMIKFVININPNQSINTEDNDNKFLTLNTQQKSDKFKEEFSILHTLSEKLNFIINLKTYEFNHIYECISQILSNTKTINFQLVNNIINEIHDELKRYTVYYSYLFTGKFGLDIDIITSNNNKFNVYLNDLSNHLQWPNNLIIAAASNIYGLKIIVVKTNTKCINYVDQIEVFEPFSKVIPLKTSIISFIYPNYYNVFEFQPTNSDDILILREKFINSSEFRHKIISDARNMAIRHLLNNPTRVHKRNRSGLQFENNDAALKVYEDHFQMTVFPTTRLANQKFRMMRDQSNQQDYNK